MISPASKAASAILQECNSLLNAALHNEGSS